MVGQYKSYTARISANKRKELFITKTLSTIHSISDFIFDNKKLWDKQSELYKLCREKYPEINSKILQNFIKLYNPKNRKQNPKKPIKPGIYLDQDFNVEIRDTSYVSHWIRFSKINFPLSGKYLSTKILDPTKIKTAHIFTKSNKIYCRLTVENESINKLNIENKLNKEINLNEYYISKLSDFVKDKPKKENIYRKDNKENLDYIHRLTSNIIKDFRRNNVEVLHVGSFESVLELVKNMSRNRKIYYGKLLNKFSYKLFRDTLVYKCQDSGIIVITEDYKKYKKYSSKYKVSTNPGRSKVKSLEQIENDIKLELKMLQIDYPDAYHALFWSVGHPEFDSWASEDYNRYSKQLAGGCQQPSLQSSPCMSTAYAYFIDSSKEQMEEFFKTHPVGIRYTKERGKWYWFNIYLLVSYQRDLERKQGKLTDSDKMEYKRKFYKSMENRTDVIIKNILSEGSLLNYSINHNS